MTLTVRFIKAVETYPLRAAVLRPGKPPETAIFPGDGEKTSFHLGAFDNEKLIGIASFLQNGHPYFKETFQYQLRGMASDENFRGSGAGRAIIAFALQHLKKNKVSLLWCNVRRGAIPFYLKCGFKETGDFFEVPEIGTHKVMYIHPQAV